MSMVQTYKYKITYLKKDGTSGTAYYTVIAPNDQAGRIIAGDKFRADRDHLINS